MRVLGDCRTFLMVNAPYEIYKNAKKVSDKYDVTIGELRSGGRRKAVVKARRVMSWISVRELGYSGADVARYLGVTNSCVTRLISSGIKQGIDNIKLDL